MEANSAVKKKRLRCKEKFLRFFPKGFYDEKYIAWERGYKWQAHLQFKDTLNEKEFARLLEKKEYSEIAQGAVKIETKTNLLFSFEKMALRDAVKSPKGAKLFSMGLYKFLYGSKSLHKRFEIFADVLSILPRKQTRVHTWPLQSVFGFIANPKEFIFLKPRVTQAAAKEYSYDFHYESKPGWKTYQSILDFVKLIKNDIADLKPRDMMDVQSFIWVLGSEEYD